MNNQIRHQARVRFVSRIRNNRAFPASTENPTVLLVDDDADVNAMLTVAFDDAGFVVTTAETGHAGMALVDSSRWELILIDLRLPDMSGVEVLKYCKASVPSMICVIMSGFLSVSVVVEVTKLGADDVIEKPVDVERLLSSARELCASMTEAPFEQRAVRDVSTHCTAFSAEPGSAVEKWVQLVLRACDSDDDPKTLQLWARRAGVSYSSLCEHCRLLGIQPQDARDLVRTLRAKLRAADYDCSPEILLNVGDRRTLRSILERAGTAFRDGPADSIEPFLLHQRFIAPGSLALRALLRVLKSANY